MPHNKTSLFAIILCVSLLLSAVPVYSQTDNPDNRYSLAAPPKFENPKLDSTLNQLIDAYEEGGIEGALAYADQHLLEVEGQRVQITAFAHNDYPQTVEAVKQAIENLGGDVQTWWGSQVQGMVPIPSLNSLAAQEVVHYVRDPLRPALDVTSEGVGLINADDYRSVVGTSGEGVKIAIVDLGFINYQSLQSSGELPGDATIASFRADGEIESETEHGAGCAEIVYDIAPDAAYYFVNYGTDTE
ncbi:MAG: hypothetical protein U9R58_08920, partial [Chloroflexota bacterium]|nr:hypothetical protein [Chloroflexota bacterium]